MAIGNPWKWKSALMRVIAALGAMIAGASNAGSPASATSGFMHGPMGQISFVQFQSPNLAVPGTTLTIEGKLSVPERVSAAGNRRRLAAVLILHGSAGVDARGDFYERALNAAGIATLQIDMWLARGIAGAGQRPSAPILTYPDAFSALAFLATRPEIDPARIGVLGFSWGGLISLGTAEQLYANMFAGASGPRFKAHVAHYPVCYAWNNTQLENFIHVTPAQFGTQFLHLTGAPVLIEVGSKDGYDNGPGPCQALAQAVNPGNGGVVSVNAYSGATHAWDRLMVPTVVSDPFADLGSYFVTGIPPQVPFTPDVEQAYLSRWRVVRFFERHL